MKHKCLYCYKPVKENKDFHENCSIDFFGTPKPPVLNYSLNEMKDLAKQVVGRSIAVPGVQPKLSLSLFGDLEGASRLTIVGALGGNYILKPPFDDYPEMPQNEHISMRIAESLGINVVKSSLIRLASGELAYITKRIDRSEDGEKTHMIDMYQITEAFDKYKSSMEKIAKALTVYSSNAGLDKIFLFELALYAFIIGNNDMHLKNFSMILKYERWTLAPAYDLLNVSIANPEDKEQMALSVNGKKNKLTKADFMVFGKNIGLTEKQIKGAFERLIYNESKYLEWINSSFLSSEMIENYSFTIESRRKVLM